MDDVIVSFLDGFLKIYNKKYNVKVSSDDITSYKFWECLPFSKEESLAIADEFYDSDHFKEIKPIEEAKETILILSKTNDLFIITSRPLKLKKPTLDFFNKHFTDMPLRIFHSKPILGEGETKSEICRSLGVSILIEDNKDYAFDCAKKGIKVFLLDKPWNRNSEEHENLIKVRNWNEILENLR